MRSALRIDNTDVGTAKVTYSGVEYTVIGILNSQKLKEIADLDNEIITPVDFIAMNKLSEAGRRAAAIRASRSTRTWSRTRSSSFRTRRRRTWARELRSIAIDFGDPKVGC